VLQNESDPAVKKEFLLKKATNIKNYYSFHLFLVEHVNDWWLTFKKIGYENRHKAKTHDNCQRISRKLYK